jgi:hypothetical protein
MDEIKLYAENLDEVFQIAAKRFPHAVDCLGFLWGALSPPTGKPEQDMAWVERILDQANKGTN